MCITATIECKVTLENHGGHGLEIGKFLNAVVYIRDLVTQEIIYQNENVILDLKEHTL